MRGLGPTGARDRELATVTLRLYELLEIEPLRLWEDVDIWPHLGREAQRVLMECTVIKS